MGTRGPCEAAAWRPYLLEVRVQLSQHRLQLVHLARQVQGWLLAAKAGDGVRLSAHSWEESRLQAPLIPEAPGRPLLAGVPGVPGGEGCAPPGAGSSLGGAWEHQA